MPLDGGDIKRHDRIIFNWNVLLKIASALVELRVSHAFTQSVVGHLETSWASVWAIAKRHYGVLFMLVASTLFMCR